MAKKKTREDGLSKKKQEEIREHLTQLNKLFDERIVELYQQKDRWLGAMQARHCYVYYRSLVWAALDIVGRE